MKNKSFIELFEWGPEPRPLTPEEIKRIAINKKNYKGLAKLAKAMRKTK